MFTRALVSGCRYGLAAMLACGAMGCAADSDSADSWFAVYKSQELTTEEPIEHGPGCVLAVYSDSSELSKSKTSGEPLELGDFVLSMHTAGKGLEVSVSSQGNLLEERNYDSAFLRSGEKDGFRVTTVAERVFELVFWGSKECPL